MKVREIMSNENETIEVKYHQINNLDTLYEREISNAGSSNFEDIGQYSEEITRRMDVASPKIVKAYELLERAKTLMKEAAGDLDGYPMVDLYDAQNSTVYRPVKHNKEASKSLEIWTDIVKIREVQQKIFGFFLHTPAFRRFAKKLENSTKTK